MTARIVPVAVGLLVTACATVPSGPSVMVLPGTGKNFEQFQTDDAICRQWAFQQTGTTAKTTTTQSTVPGAPVGTSGGTATGAASAAGSPATEAAVVAGSGEAGASAQRRYDITYMQCMYAKGNQIPVARGSQQPYTSQQNGSQSAPPNVPPPPAGTPPAPPPASSR